MKKFFKQFSFPSGTGSHATPETPGSIHEGGELGYARLVFDNPDLITLTMSWRRQVRDRLATSWHSTEFSCTWVIFRD